MAVTVLPLGRGSSPHSTSPSQCLFTWLPSQAGFHLLHSPGRLFVFVFVFLPNVEVWEVASPKEGQESPLLMRGYHQLFKPSILTVLPQNCTSKQAQIQKAVLFSWNSVNGRRQQQNTGHAHVKVSVCAHTHTDTGAHMRERENAPCHFSPAGFCTGTAMAVQFLTLAKHNWNTAGLQGPAGKQATF